MKDGGEADRPSGVFREVRSAAASYNQYTAWFQAIPCKLMERGEIEAVTGVMGPPLFVHQKAKRERRRLGVRRLAEFANSEPAAGSAVLLTQTFADQFPDPR